MRRAGYEASLVKGLFQQPPNLVLPWPAAQAVLWRVLIWSVPTFRVDKYFSPGLAGRRVAGPTMYFWAMSW